MLLSHSIGKACIGISRMAAVSNFTLAPPEPPLAIVAVSA
jgi:hypothetical protein